MNNRLQILSIDVGYHNLGLVIVSCEKNYTIPLVEKFYLIDLTSLDKNLTFSQRNDCSTLVERLTIAYKEVFDRSDLILIESQPPQGLIAIEQLLVHMYRNKVILIHPRTMHKYFGFGSDYEVRKEQCIFVAEYYLEMLINSYHKKNLDYFYAAHQCLEEFRALQRKHDVGDAICYAFMKIEKIHHSKIHKKIKQLVSKLNIKPLNEVNKDETIVVDSESIIMDKKETITIESDSSVHKRKLYTVYNFKTNHYGPVEKKIKKSPELQSKEQIQKRLLMEWLKNYEIMPKSKISNLHLYNDFISFLNNKNYNDKVISINGFPNMLEECGYEKTYINGSVVFRNIARKLNDENSDVSSV